MFEQDPNDRFTSDVLILIKPELFETFILAHEVRWRIRQESKNSLEVLSAQGILQVFDNVELDAALTQNVERSARLPSARVVVDQESFHCQRLHSVRYASTYPE